jgi:hypothetical protein
MGNCVSLNCENNEFEKLPKSVYQILKINNELFQVHENGSVISNDLEIIQSGNVLSCGVVMNKVALLLEKEKTHHVQYIDGNGTTEFAIELKPNPKEFAIGNNCCFVLCMLFLMCR